ncbi:hypothetical protein GDO81_008598 [Engystomops pustulosus]|uniref:Shieldin complex subunit 1 C-terminal domain-containing protein n=1 Tax=Engystomops pustulosus TaxID=76066 RepID=A0AAV7CFY1_ENGPU|nr:hypothetical protein GDO81_008598 [Engystomops pustulosus]KAG8583939.1 hypothetical protein GDO81_008598 [Engystomops pustulosus]KAG8583940.1 hypothetical protein GDO81_008598 [Engystomops pustulosus]
MNPADAGSQTSDCSGVVDLSCTYKLSQCVPLQEDSPRSWQEDFCSTLTSTSSLASQRNPGSRKNSCDDNEELPLEEDKKSQFVPQSSDASVATQQSAATLNSLHKLETKQGLNDEQIRARLDAFYEQSSWRGKDDAMSHQFSEKISDLSKKQHLYALRSFQLGKIVLNQEGEKILQSCSSNRSFSSRGVSKKVDPIPGLSDDVVRFIMDRTSNSHD